MKLFVWCDPYQVDYGSSMVIAVADSLDEAKRIAKEKSKSYSFGKYEGDSIPNIELGEPDRVIDIPCAEWHSWEE